MTACIACEGTGTRSIGGDCPPCAGTGQSLAWVSPSRIADQRLCRRKRWYRQVAKIYRPPHPSAVLGTAVHAQIERYLKGAGEIDSSTKEGAIAIKGLYLLPAPPQHFVELAPKFARNQSFGYSGKIDLFMPNPLTVIDHKTSSNPKRYGLTTETLPQDPQAIIYSWFGLQLVPNAQTVNLQWNYFPTRGGRPFPVRAVMQRDYVEHALATIDETARQILEDNRITSAEEVPGDISACGAFGGCGYIDICSIARQSSLALALSEGASSKGKTEMTINSEIIERIRSAQAAAGQPAPAAAPPAVAVPVPAPPLAPAPPPAPAVEAPVAQSDALQAVLAQLRGGQAALPVAPPTPTPAPVATIAQPPTAIPAPPVAPAPTPPVAPAPNGHYTLYVNCIPIGIDYMSADILIAQANQMVCEQENVTHYKAMGFGKGTGVLVNALSELLTAMNGSIVVLPGRESSDALHCLRFFAGSIVQGI